MCIHTYVCIMYHISNVSYINKQLSHISWPCHQDTNLPIQGTKQPTQPITHITTKMSQHNTLIGKLNLSCDVIVVNNLSHQVIVSERTYIKKQSPDWTTARNHHIT